METKECWGLHGQSLLFLSFTEVMSSEDKDRGSVERRIKRAGAAEG